jgi:hypothetical protein
MDWIWSEQALAKAEIIERKRDHQLELAVTWTLRDYHAA